MIPCANVLERLHLAISFGRVGEMSIRENIQIYPRIDLDQFLAFLKNELGAVNHPAQTGAYLLDGLPFYKPERTEDHDFILGFNYAQLPLALIQTLIDHPEIFSDEISIRWTQEQDLILEDTLGDLR